MLAVPSMGHSANFRPRGFLGADWMGIGIVPLPEADVQKLVSRTEGEGAVFELSCVMCKRQSFSGARYRDLSEAMNARTRGMGQ